MKDSEALASLRERLSSNRGKEYWRSLEELAGTAEFEQFVAKEFPACASEWTDPVGRRTFLKLMAASLALAGLEGCAHQPAEEIVPFVRQPDEIVPGKALYFATAMTLSGVGTGLLVKSVEGRPVKIEGNPEHSSSLGASDVFSQASLLSLYDPDRSQTVTYRGVIRSWSSFLGDIQVTLERLRGRQGMGLRLLTETMTSPALAHQISELLVEFPQAKWHQYEPANRDYARAGARLGFGSDVESVYAFDKADRVLSLGSDFLSCGRGHLKYVRDFSARRRVTQTSDSMNRLYVVETTPSNTGAKADHRLVVHPSEMESLALALASALGVLSSVGSGTQPQIRAGAAHWLAAAARDLSAHPGKSLVIAGDEQPPYVHSLVHQMNQALGNAGKTVLYISPLEASSTDHLQSLHELASDMDGGRVEALLIVGGNPVYNAPADLSFAHRLAKVNLRVHLGLYEDETSDLCHWHIPQAHYLESWGDSRAYDGTVMLTQPLIAPLYYGKTASEMIAAFSRQPERSGYNILRVYWKKHWIRFGAGDFEQWWRKSVHDGFITGSAFAAAASAAAQGDVKPALSQLRPGSTGQPPNPSVLTPSSGGTPADAGSLEIVFRTDPAVYDGCFSNNGWLQELPKPLTKLTWDNAVMISPKTAEKLGISMQAGSEGGNYSVDVVELRYAGRSIKAPIWILPGQAENCVTLHLGYGRTRAGRVGTGAGFNAFTLRTSDHPWAGSGLSIRKTGARYRLSSTQLHHTMENRYPVQSATLEEYRRKPDSFHEHEGRPGERSASLYPPFRYEGYAWGMAIDTTACVGCSACVVACQSENNIPVVGKDEIARSREMHWIRIDRYYQGNRDEPQTYFQPVPCMHCENAPCEPVCPVGATVHSTEGLNEMVYNRCVGTRYCANNCPYKVRRFNFLLYSDWNTPSLKLGRNPEVTVRSRGVMEKCTYCVQRINAARIEAEKENRPIRDGEIVTACQAACPAEAIVFGDINDPNSRVAKLKAQPRNYSLLSELNTRPRTTYLAALRNPNPDLERTER